MKEEGLGSESLLPRSARHKEDSTTACMDLGDTENVLFVESS